MNKKLTTKQKAFVEYYLNHPKQSATEAAMQTYNCKNRHVAEQIAHANLRKVEILGYLQSFSELSEETIVRAVRDWGRSENPRKRDIAVRSAIYMYNQIHGKPTTKLDIATSTVRVAINLTGDGEEPPSDLLEVAPI